MQSLVARNYSQVHKQNMSYRPRQGGSSSYDPRLAQQMLLMKRMQEQRKGRDLSMLQLVVLGLFALGIFASLLTIGLYYGFSAKGLRRFIEVWQYRFKQLTQDDPGSPPAPPDAPDAEEIEPIVELPTVNLPRLRYLAENGLTMLVIGILILVFTFVVFFITGGSFIEGTYWPDVDISKGIIRYFGMYIMFVVGLLTVSIGFLAYFTLSVVLDFETKGGFAKGADNYISANPFLVMWGVFGVIAFVCIFGLAVAVAFDAFFDWEVVVSVVMAIAERFNHFLIASFLATLAAFVSHAQPPKVKEWFSPPLVSVGKVGSGAIVLLYISQLLAMIANNVIGYLFLPEHKRFPALAIPFMAAISTYVIGWFIEEQAMLTLQIQLGGFTQTLIICSLFVLLVAAMEQSMFLNPMSGMSDSAKLVRIFLGYESAQNFQLFEKMRDNPVGTASSVFIAFVIIVMGLSLVQGIVHLISSIGLSRFTGQYWAEILATGVNLFITLVIMFTAYSEIQNFNVSGLIVLFVVTAFSILYSLNLAGFERQDYLKVGAPTAIDVRGQDSVVCWGTNNVMRFYRDSRLHFAQVKLDEKQNKMRYYERVSKGNQDKYVTRKGQSDFRIYSFTTKDGKYKLMAYHKIKQNRKFGWTPQAWGIFTEADDDNEVRYLHLKNRYLFTSWVVPRQGWPEAEEGFDETGGGNKIRDPCYRLRATPVWLMEAFFFRTVGFATWLGNFLTSVTSYFIWGALVYLFLYLNRFYPDFVYELELQKAAFFGAIMSMSFGFLSLVIIEVFKAIGDYLDSINKDIDE